MDWAQDVLKHFRYGEAFLDINSKLLKRYAACSNEEEVKKTEEEWLEKIEREYEESRATTADDMWTSGNTNRIAVSSDSDEDEDKDEDEGDDKESENGEEEEKDPFAISDNSDDEEQMAEIRRKVLNSKSFQNPSIPEKPQPEKISRPEPLPVDSDAESGSADSDDEAFDNIINATPVTDRTGIISSSRRKGKETFSASFSRTVMNAPQRW